MSLADDVLAGDRRALGRAITLVESTRPDHRAEAVELLQAVLPHTGTGIRLGVSGAPGVGKSTFIDAFGCHVIEQGTTARGAGRRPVVGSLGRLHPRRQDPHGGAGPAARGVHPPLPRRPHARRRGPSHPRGDAAVRGRRLRRRAGRDRRRGPVRDGRGRDGRPVLPARRAGRRRRPAGRQARRDGAGRAAGGHQGRRRPRPRRQPGVRRPEARPPADAAAPPQLDAAGRPDLGPHRHGPRRGVGRGARAPAGARVVRRADLDARANRPGSGSGPSCARAWSSGSSPTPATRCGPPSSTSSPAASCPRWPPIASSTSVPEPFATRSDASRPAPAPFCRADRRRWSICA